MAFINYIVGLIAFYYAWQFAFKKKMVVPDPWVKGQKYICNQQLSFLIYCILTAMLFLGPLSLVKYGVWIVIMLIMSFKPGFKKPWNGVMGAYTLFVLWNIYTISYSAYPYQGWMMVLKFCLPYLYFWLGYNAIKCEDDFYAFLKRTCWICCLYALFLGGIISKFLPSLKALFTYSSGGLFISYASLADFFAILFTVPFVMYVVTKKKSYLYMAAWLFLSSVVDSVRTGIGASILGMGFFYMIYKKGRAVPYMALGLLVFIISIFAVPAVREKMFGESAATVSVGSVSMDQVEMNGRNYLWEMIMERCYYGNETFGSGCGAALGWLKEIHKDGGLVLIHSDWVQMMSESGNIGLGLFIFFAIVMLFKVLGVTWAHQHSRTATFAGAMTVAAFAACFFAMGFDNLITYAQQGYVLPFMMLGIFYKTIYLKL